MKNLFKKIWEFLLEFGDFMISLFLMVFLAFAVVYAGIITHLSGWEIIRLLVIFCFCPFFCGYVFRNWISKEKKHLTENNFELEYINDIEKDLDIYDKKDLIKIMKYFEKQHKREVDFL